jgi:DNA-binding GntR family transcriptional regulator
VGLEALVPRSDAAVEQAATAQQEAYCHIREQILTGALGPGGRINPAVIADALEISRMPVREALRQLDTEGLVNLRPNRSATVVDLTPFEVEEYFQIRAALESLAVGFAVAQLTAADMAQLTLMKEQLNQAEDQRTRWLALHRRFHDTLCDRCERPHLLREVRRISDLLTPCCAAHLAMQGIDQIPNHEHDDVLEAVHTRDIATVEEIIKRHVLMPCEGILAHMRDR